MNGFASSAQDMLERAMAELRRGAAIALRDSTRLCIVASAETADARRFAAFRAMPEAVLALTARRARVLKIRVYDGETVRLPLPRERATVRALADPADDLATPLKGPFRALRDAPEGVARLAIDLCKRARLLPAAILAETSDAGDVPVFDASTLSEVLESAALSLERFSDARVPLSLAGNARVFGFRPSDGGPDHFAILVGDPPRGEPVLVRAHSECYTGDQLGSLKCDCGPQLRAALAQMSAEGAGVLLYLAQEGRGIGMANKLRAYALQDQGFDTVDANHRLGFEDDERDFRVAALMLRSLRFTRVRVLTNNPRKLAAFERHGIAVEGRVPLAVGRTAQNEGYLETKAARNGHLL